MRLTDDRYAQERRQLEVALRMIHFEARTQTIRECTGMSEDRVRKLYKSYAASRDRVRHRGKSPRQIDCVFRTAHTWLHASVLAGALATLGLLDPQSHGRSVDTELADRICDAYELYLTLLADRPLTFEHAWFVWRELTRDGDLYLSPCATCYGLNLQDKLSVRTRPCPWCGAKHS